MDSAKFLLPMFISLLLPAVSFAQADIKWGSATQKQMRTQLEGTRIFYDETKVKKEGGLVFLTAYESGDPSRNDHATDYAINCKTEEIALKENAVDWSKPIRYVPGESLYNLGKKFCGWSAKPGFWKSITE